MAKPIEVLNNPPAWPHEDNGLLLGSMVPAEIILPGVDGYARGSLVVSTLTDGGSYSVYDGTIGEDPMYPQAVIANAETGLCYRYGQFAASKLRVSGGAFTELDAAVQRQIAKNAALNGVIIHLDK